MLAVSGAWRSQAAWKQARAWAIRQWRATGEPPCELCGEKISDGQVHVDHRVKVKDGGGRYDPANLRVVHGKCNLSRANGGQSISAIRRQRAKTREWGWQPQPEDLAKPYELRQPARSLNPLRQSGDDAEWEAYRRKWYPPPSREW